MIRLLPAMIAAASSSLVYGIVPDASPPSAAAIRIETPDVIGKDKPVFLGRMVVTATPLPAE